ncbi:MAG TPA: phosphopantetheine-binding protein [Vicinamibacteria bacterium]|nr:phosphopantetheine-binding protein [Vicinamibacteria bacterium]
MSDIDALSRELRDLLIQELNLKMSPDDLPLDDPLLDVQAPTGAKIDSLDVLSLIMAIEDRYGVRLPQTKDELQVIFKSVRSVAENVDRLRTEVSA